MATCPRCGDFLDEHHRCSWRHRARAIGMSALAMLGGATLSLIVLYAVSDTPSVITVGIGVASGMILGQAVWTATHH